ncbi:unnamed protein product, partial [Iphiclides podalirius]
MWEDEDSYLFNSYLSILPTEIILFIFKYLTAKDLVRCRGVCLRFKQIVDGQTGRDRIWRKHCKIDYPNIYKIARYKSQPDCLWYNIYRSLTLWPKLASAREIYEEFSLVSKVSEEITDLKILRNGVIAVHKQSGIFYYDIKTLKQTNRGPIAGLYLRYTENDDVILIHSHHLHIIVLDKITLQSKFTATATLDEVKTFILVDQDVYYVTLRDAICVCNLKNYRNRVITHSEDAVMSIGFSHNKLHVLTFQRNVYTLNGMDLTFVCEIGPDCNLLHQLYYYNFFETIDWRIFHQWVYILNHRIPSGPLQSVVIIRTYGEVVFIGSNWGVLRIYNAPFTAGELDLYNKKHTKQYNFMENSDFPVNSKCPILQIDVSETKDGHTVVVAMPKKIAVLNFTHHFERTVSVATSPYQ